MSSKNLSFSLIEPTIETKNQTEVTYDSLVSLVNEQSSNMGSEWNEGLSIDDYVASEIDYNENYTKKQLANIIQKHVSDIKIEIVKSKTDPRNYKVSFDKIKQILNFQPKRTVENSVVEILSKIEDGTVDPRQSEFSNMSKLTTEINALTNYQFDENL